MTGSLFDGAVVHERLRIMRELLDDLDQVGEPSAAKPAELGRGPATYRESFALAAQAGALPADLADRLAPSAGLRNILTHEYVAVDLAIVATSVPLVRMGYRAYVSAVARWVARHPAAEA